MRVVVHDPSSRSDNSPAVDGGVPDQQHLITQARSRAFSPHWLEPLFCAARRRRIASRLLVAALAQQKKQPPWRILAPMATAKAVNPFTRDWLFKPDGSRHEFRFPLPPSTLPLA